MRFRSGLTLVVAAAVSVCVLLALFGRNGGDSDPFLYFDEIYVLTVPSRRARVRETLNRVGLRRAHIVDAVTKPQSAADWDRLKQQKEFIPDTLEMLTAGEVAVSMSQRKALRQFLAAPDARRALLFEDDFEPNGFGLRQRLRESLKYLSSVQREVDILFLGRCHDDCTKDELVGGDLYRVWYPACLHAWSANRRAARAVIKSAQQCAGPHCPIDNVVRRLVQPNFTRPNNESDFAGYAVSPQLFTQAQQFRAKNESMVRANTEDIQRMRPDGEHWVHALRENRTSKKPAWMNSDTLHECRWSRLRLLISNVNQFADRNALKPRPKLRVPSVSTSPKSQT